MKMHSISTQELRAMETMGSADDSSRRKSVFAADQNLPEGSHLKTELVLMQRKYERLAQKERRMMVNFLI